MNCFSNQWLIVIDVLEDIFFNRVIYIIECCDMAETSPDFDDDSIDSLPEHLNFLHQDLSGHTFTGDLSGVFFNHTMLDYANFTGVNLTNATFWTNLKHVNFSGANLTNIRCTNLNASFSNFSHANLTNATIYGLNVTGSDFSGANLTNADLTDVNFTQANLTGANLTGADVTDIILHDANLTGVIGQEELIQNAREINVERERRRQTLDFSDSDYSHEIFTGDLSGANFQNTNLEYAVFADVNLTNADFSNNRNMSGINFSGANLTNANFQRAYVTHSRFVGANLTNATLTDANFRNTDLSGANITDADIGRYQYQNPFLDDAILTNVIGHEDFIARIIERREQQRREQERLDRIRLEQREEQREREEIEWENNNMAFEVHHTFAKFPIYKYNTIITTFLTSQGIPIDTGITREEIETSYKSIIQNDTTEETKEETKEEKENKLVAILNRVTVTDIFKDTRNNQIIGNSVRFVMKQEPNFQHLYMDTFIQDCYHAYQGEEGMSCAKGIVERFSYVVCTTAQYICMEQECTPLYQELIDVYTKQIDLNMVAQQWDETDALSDTNLTTEELRASFRNFAIQKYKEAGYGAHYYEPILNQYIDGINYAFQQRAFGGTRRTRNRRKLRKRSTIKYQRHPKKLPKRKSNNTFHSKHRYTKKRKHRFGKKTKKQHRI
jgi:uncharacterized protein YjbI with pentapeptide repeats